MKKSKFTTRFFYDYYETKCLLYVKGIAKPFIGRAFCNPEDEFNKKIGRVISQQRSYIAYYESEIKKQKEKLSVLMSIYKQDDSIPLVNRTIKQIEKNINIKKSAIRFCLNVIWIITNPYSDTKRKEELCEAFLNQKR